MVTENMTEKKSCVDPYKQRIEEEIKRQIPLLGPSSPLRDACEYALLNGGKRYRPLISLLISEALQQKAPIVSAALAVEYFHTASLVADDLPCMDDDEERRSLPATHRKYGEALALLVSYALIAAGYKQLADNTEQLRTAGLAHSSDCDTICVLALQNATYNTGLYGATGGQFLDMYAQDLDLKTVREVIEKKTSSLFEIAFVCGWAYGGGALNRLTEVKQLAAHFGMAFQIADDLQDVEQDRLNDRAVNMAKVAGAPAAKKMFHEEIEAYQQMLRKLNIETAPLLQIAMDLKEMVVNPPL